MIRSVPCSKALGSQGMMQAEGDGAAMPMVRCWWRAPAVSQGSAKSKGRAGQGAAASCYCWWGDEAVTPGQFIPIPLSGRYHNDVLEYFAQLSIDLRL